MTEPVTEELLAFGKETNGDAPEGIAAPSVLDKLRGLRERKAAEHVFDVEVPGYRGLVVLRLGPMPGAAFTRVRKRWETSKSPQRDFNLNADTVIEACLEILVRAEREDELQLIGEDESGPIRLDDRLVPLLRLPPAQSARDVLLGVFALAPSPELAIERIAGEFGQWATGVEQEVDEDFLGES